MSSEWDSYNALPLGDAFLCPKRILFVFVVSDELQIASGLEASAYPALGHAAHVGKVRIYRVLKDEF